MSEQPRLFCIGTHHKTGTVWMRRTFHRYASENGFKIVRISKRSRPEDLPSHGSCLLVNWESQFPRAILDLPFTRALHVIRDPRDVLISGARYHLTAPTGNEKWLATPRPQFGGLTYQEKICSIEDPLEQLRFEMQFKHRETLFEMLNWPYGHEHVVDLKFEDLVNDTDTSIFRAALEKMNVAGFAAEDVAKFYWEHALFGGLKKGMSGLVASHIKSGKAAQWRRKFPREIAEEYERKFGKALIALGYSTGDDWVDECLPAAEIYSD